MKIFIELTRDDLFEWKQSDPLKDINLSSFLIPRKLIFKAHKITFIEDDGSKIILKNRG